MEYIHDCQADGLTPRLGDAGATRGETRWHTNSFLLAACRFPSRSLLLMSLIAVSGASTTHTRTPSERRMRSSPRMPPATGGPPIPRSSTDRTVALTAGPLPDPPARGRTPALHLQREENHHDRPDPRPRPDL